MIIMTGCASNPNEIDPKLKKAKIYYNQGTADLYHKDYTKALKNLLAADELDPNNPKINNNLGMAYYFKQDKTRAIEHISKALEIDPKHTEARMNIATIYFNTGEPDKAMPIYQEILKDLVYESQYLTHYNIGMIYLQRNQIDKAKEHFVQAVKVFESYCPAHYQLGTIHYKQKNYEKAYTNFYNSGVGQCYNSPEPHYMQGLALVQLERFADATTKFELILGRFDNSKYAALARRKMMAISHLIEHDIKSEFSVQSKIKKKLLNRDF